MRRALLAACLLLVSPCCVPLPPGEGFQSCDMYVAGDIDSRLAPSGLRREDLNAAVLRALNAATFTTDPRLNDQTENCRMLMGYRVYTKATASWVRDIDGLRVAGETSCVFRMITVGTPKDNKWEWSALVHEIFHVMQGCSGTLPADDPKDAPGHENWTRDGIYRAIDASMVLP